MITRLAVLVFLLCLIPNTGWSAPSLAQVQQAALGGDAASANRLGVWYEKGQNGLPKDPAKAVSWYRKATELGNILAMHNLGDCYLQAVGVAYDPVQAYAWYKMAAEAGGAIGYEDLGKFYHKVGFGKPDLEKAKTWYAQAARQGRKTAQENLLALGGPRLAKGKPLAPCRRETLGGGSLKGTLVALSEHAPKGNGKTLLTLNVKGKQEALLAHANSKDKPLSSLLADPESFLGKELSLGFVEVQGLDDATAICTTHREYLAQSLKGQPEENTAENVKQKNADIYIAYDALLIGAFLDKTWVNAETLQNDPKYQSKRLWGGNSGRIYSQHGYVGEGIMSALFNDHPETYYASHGPLAEFPFFTLETPQGIYEEEALFICGSGQDFNALPRSMRQVENNEHFTKTMRDYLKVYGITASNLHNEVFAVDFDGDGVDEYLIAAENVSESMSTGKGTKPLYSVILLETQKNGEKVFQPVLSYLCPKAPCKTMPTKHQIKLCADVNADGNLELIVYSSVHEGGNLQIFTLREGLLYPVLEQGFGV